MPMSSSHSSLLTSPLPSIILCLTLLPPLPLSPEQTLKLIQKIQTARIPSHFMDLTGPNQDLKWQDTRALCPGKTPATGGKMRAQRSEIKLPGVTQPEDKRRHPSSQARCHSTGKYRLFFKTHSGAVAFKQITNLY